MRPSKDDPVILGFLKAIQGFQPGGKSYLASFEDDQVADWVAVRDHLVAPALRALGYSADSMERRESAEGDGSEILVRGPSGQPFLMGSVRSSEGRRLPLYRPYFLNSQFKRSGAVVGILTDGDGLEIWERRGNLMLKLVELRLTGTVRRLEAGDAEGIPDEVWRGLQRVAYIERTFQFPLRFGEAPPPVRDGSGPESRSSLPGDVDRMAHLVRWDIRARHGRSLGELSRAPTDTDAWGEGSETQTGDISARILSCFRNWVAGRYVGNPVTQLKPYLDELVQFTVARLFVMRYYEEKGLLGRPEGLSREGAPSGILYQYERMRRIYPDFFGSGPFDWYLPDEFTTRAIRLSLDRHKMGGLGAWEAYDLLRPGGNELKSEILRWVVSEAAVWAESQTGGGVAGEDGEEVPASGPRAMVVDGGDGLATLAMAHVLLALPDWGARGAETDGNSAERARIVEVLAQDSGSGAFATLGYLLWAADAAGQGAGRGLAAGSVQVAPLRLRTIPRGSVEVNQTGAPADPGPLEPLDLIVCDLVEESALRSGGRWLAEMGRVRPGGVVALVTDAIVAPTIPSPPISSFVMEDSVDLKLVNFCGVQGLEASGTRQVAILYRRKGPKEHPGMSSRPVPALALVGRRPSDPGALGGRSAGRLQGETGSGLEAEVIRDFRSVHDLDFGSYTSFRVSVNSLLDRGASRLKLDYHPKREAVLSTILKDSSPLGSLARVFRGPGLQELGDEIRWDREVGEEAKKRDLLPTTVKVMAMGEEVGRYWLEWAGRKWTAYRDDGMLQPLAAGLPSGCLTTKILVRVQSRRLIAALDREGVLPSERIHGVAPISADSEQRKALLALMNSALATLVLRAWSGAPKELGDSIELDRFLEWFPVRPWAGGRCVEVARLVDGIHFCNDTIRKRRAKLGSFANLAQEAWVTFVPLKETRGLLASWKVPAVVKGLGPVVREGRTVSAGDDLCFVCRGDDTARYLEELLRHVFPRLEGMTGFDVEGLLSLPKTEAEISLVLHHADRVREAIDTFTRRRYEHEKEIDRLVLETYGVGPADMEALAEA